MKQARLIVTGSIILGLLVFTLFTYSPELPDNPQEEVWEKSESSFVQQTLLLEGREELLSFAITRKNAYLKFRKEKERWELISPVRGVVNHQFWLGLNKQFHGWTLEKSFTTSKKQLSQFGLSSPHYRLIMETNLNPEPRTLLVGNIAADGQFTYVAWENEKRVHLLNGNIREALATPLADIRNPNLFTMISPQQIERASVARGGTVWSFSRQSDVWYLSEPSGGVLQPKRTEAFIEQWLKVSFEEYSWSREVPEIQKENGITLFVGPDTFFSCWVGKLDPKRGDYPVYCPEEKVSGWVSQEFLEPLLSVTFNSLFPRYIAEVPLNELNRVEIIFNNRQFLFIRQSDGFWHRSQEGSVESFAIFENFLMQLSELEYLKRLGLNEKTSLFLNNSEIRAIVTLFLNRKDTVPFREYKFYERDLNYLEVDSEPPLYIIPQSSWADLLQWLQPLGRAS